MNFLTNTWQRIRSPLLLNSKKKSSSANSASSAHFEDYKTDKVIQDGKFSQIYLARDKDGSQVVIKKIDTTLIRAELIQNEIEAGLKLKHNGIGRLIRHFEENGFIFLILEYIQGVDLFEYLQLNDFRALKEHEAKKIFQQIVEITEFIHKKGIVHRDLKLENVMLKANHKVKIIDFGLCAQAPCDSMLDSFLGSVEYACPEILDRRPYNGCKAEVWSLGVMLFALLYGQFPFSTYDRERKFRVELTFPADSTVSSTAKDLVTSMLQVDPEMRFNLKEVSKHKWLRS